MRDEFVKVALCLISAPIIIFTMICIYSLVNTLLTAGSGRVVAKENRGGHVVDQSGSRMHSGLFLLFENGTELQVFAVWDQIKIGDQVSKEKYSLSYTIQGEKIGTLGTTLRHSFRTTRVPLIVFMSVLAIYSLVSYVKKP